MATDALRGFGLYVHWPFCEAKCPYCDFNSHVVSAVDQTRWAAALCREIRRYAALTPGRVLHSVFFGGGTPSLMMPETVNAVLEAARDAWPWANDIEITLEANPRSVEAERFVGYAAAGVNRVSLGVQALRDDDLRRLGRLHDASEARAAFDLARKSFDRVSFDLIYARQDQSLSDWKVELSEALSMAADHLSLYQLTIEPGTAFGERFLRGGLRGLPEEALSADMYDLTQDLCVAAGLPAYEVSNHARTGAESRHNMIYWRGGEYIGVGPGAHGRLTLNSVRSATSSVTTPGAWLLSVENGTDPATWEQQTNRDVAVERLMMGIRLSEGLNLDSLHTLDAAVAEPKKLDFLQEQGLIWISGARFGATRTGRLILNALIAELAPD